MRWSIRSLLAWTAMVACTTVVGCRYWALAVLILSMVPCLFYVVHVRLPKRILWRFAYSLCAGLLLIPPYIASTGVATFFIYRYQFELPDSWVWHAMGLYDAIYAPAAYIIPNFADDAYMEYTTEWTQYSESYFGITEMVLERHRAMIQEASAIESSNP